MRFHSANLPSSFILFPLSKDFSFALKLFNEHILKPEAQKAKNIATVAADPSPSSNSQKGDKSNKKSRPGENVISPSISSKSPVISKGKTGAGKDPRPPIIIVPSALSGIISSMNAADFLQNSTYISIEEKRKNGAPREKERFITRNVSTDVKSKYLLVDNAKLNPKDWDRVVAVFATGQAWQFKDWPVGYSNPVELFSKVQLSHRCILYFVNLDCVK